VNFLTFAFAFVLLLSILIFVHELGHFLVAKWCGVRVLKFSLGFGPPIGFGRYRARWVSGHTEYVLAWFPLGGFVKMLGENPDETDDPALIAHPSETLGAKKTWQKLAIVFAGPAMNLLLPIVVFMGTLAVGLPRPEATLGMVEKGSPAAEAGLRAGDEIVALGGEAIGWWSDFDEEVRARAGDTVTVLYRRDGQERQSKLHIDTRPSFDEIGIRVEVGWSGAWHRRASSIVGVPDGNTPAHTAGLRSGDQVVSVAGVEVEDWEGFAAAYAAVGSQSVTLGLRRGPLDAREDGSVVVPVLGSTEALGVIPANVLISTVRPGSPADNGGLARGDLIVSVDGAPVGSFASFAETVRTSEGRALDIAFARDGEVTHVAIAPKMDLVDSGLGIEEPRYLVGITAEMASLGGASALDQQRNPLLSFPRAVEMTVDLTGSFLRGLGSIATGEVSRNQLAGPIGIAEIAGNAWQRGWETYLSILVLISINLGILNLLPIPILDGGQAVIYAVEGIKRSPLSLRTREIFQQVGFTLLIMLMGLAFWNDLSRQWTKLVEWLGGS
jgi:regulator of sigma E protease